MKIAIATNEESKEILTIKEFEPINSKGEVAHFLAELEVIKLELLDIWEEVADWEE